MAMVAYSNSSGVLMVGCALPLWVGVLLLTPSPTALSTTKLLALGKTVASTLCSRLLATVPLSLLVEGELSSPIPSGRGGITE